MGIVILWACAGAGCAFVLWTWWIRPALVARAWRRDGQRVHLETSRRLARYRERLDHAPRAT